MLHPTGASITTRSLAVIRLDVPKLPLHSIDGADLHAVEWTLHRVCRHPRLSARALGRAMSLPSDLAVIVRRIAAVFLTLAVMAAQRHAGRLLLAIVHLPWASSAARLRSFTFALRCGLASDVPGRRC